MTAYLVKNVLPFEGQTQAKRLASDIFNNLFITCIEKTFDEIDAKFETYAAWIRPKESFVCCHYSNTIQSIWPVGQNWGADQKKSSNWPVHRSKHAHFDA